MKNKEIKTKRKSLLPLLLTILIMLLAFVACAVAIGTSGNDDNSETVEVSAVIPKKKNSEISETTEKATTTENITTTSKTTQTTEKTTATTKTTTTSTEPVELEFTQLYLDFFEPYTDSIDKLMPEGFRQANSEKFADYDVQITEGNEDDMWSFTISDSNGDKVYMSFYPTNDVYENPPEDWIETLTLLTYNSGDKEISISDRYHLDSKPTYNTYDKNRNTPNQEVNSLDELKIFMFGVNKKSSETETTISETTTTTTTTAPPATEPPTEAPTPAPPPPEPVQPVIAESDYVLNTSTMKAHKPNCRDVEKIDPENRWDYYGTVEDIQSMGYSSCGHCHAW